MTTHKIYRIERCDACNAILTKEEYFHKKECNEKEWYCERCLFDEEGEYTLFAKYKLLLFFIKKIATDFDEVSTIQEHAKALINLLEAKEIP